MIDESHDIRWKQRFTNFQKALSLLQKFIDKGELSELEAQGLIKAFEYTFELAWTTLKDFLEYRGQSEIYGSRDAIRKAFQLNLIEDGNNSGIKPPLLVVDADTVLPIRREIK